MRLALSVADMSDALQKLRAPFPANQISYLPKGGVKLAYVGHAALTDRLLDTDPAWTWEPLSIGANGLPVLDESGGLWIKLNVCGVTRLGYGDAGQKKGGDAMKERIGDALRNAAMRFGAALDLWHKGELHFDELKHSVMSAQKVADWQCFISEAGDADDLNRRTAEAHAAAKEVKDRDAYAAFTASKRKRAAQLEQSA